MKTQDVIADLQEQADDLTLQMVFERQQCMTGLYERIAELLYQARAIYIGGMCLPWKILSPGQRRKYIDEVRGLVKGEPK